MYDRDIVQDIFDIISDSGYMVGSTSKFFQDLQKRLDWQQNVAPNADWATNLKAQICENFIRYQVEKKLTRDEFAEMLNIPPSRISEITHYRVDKFTLDKLFKLYERLLKHMISQRKIDNLKQSTILAIRNRLE